MERVVQIGVMGKNRLGQPLKVFSLKMQKRFGDFDGKISFQRSPTRWVDSACIDRAAGFMRSL